MNDQVLGLSSGSGQELESEFHCATCSDEALPARVLATDEASSMAVVELQGATTEVDISLVDNVEPGDTLLVHGGVALFMQSKRHTNV
ncbi:MAG: HypC/HybG/HupF family hydrogenase formation chaperone [Chloroflexia bacterium]